ncbi:MAG: 4Fe-4S dicluster domain-containing protein [Candidatus Bathyarchaeia archaeon]
MLISTPNLCIGCHSCEIACKQINSLPLGVFRIKVEEMGPKCNTNGNLIMKFRIVKCTQCEKPRCVNVCPMGALRKREDGIVVVDRSLCTGCKACINACPIHAIWFNPETGKIEKCDLCVDKGLDEPFCIKHCVTKALREGINNRLSWIPW